MIYEVFILGGIAWWLLSTLFIIIMLYEICNDKAFRPAIVLLIYCGLITLFGNASLFSKISEHPEIIYIGLPLYAVIGGLWSIIKWILFLKREVKKYKEAKDNFEPTNSLVSKEEAWERAQHYNSSIMSFPIKARHHKERIVSWIAYWPVSIIWDIISKPWTSIYNLLISTYQRIADKITSEV